MTPAVRKLMLIFVVNAIVVAPIAGSWQRWGGWPPGFGIFPPVKVMDPPGFNQVYFIAASLVALLLLAYLVAPQLFGFKPPPPVERPAVLVVPYPKWFYVGLIVMFPCWYLMWFGDPSIAKWTFVPLWWGGIAALDGVVYRRNGGVSLFTDRAWHIFWLSVMSILGWYLFEWLNWFAIENWYYPNTKVLSPLGNFIWFTLAYTTVWPAVFEWYTLFRTIPSLDRRWEFGPKLSFGRWFPIVVTIAGLAMIALMGRLPFLLFWAMWIGPMVVLGGALAALGLWTPYQSIARGDWSRVTLVAVASLFTGFFWEGWNYGSEFFRHGVPSNPNYWIYDIPYVNVIHLFSEMPLLGYFGYLFFGLLVWGWWLVCVHLVGLEADFMLPIVNAKGERVPR